jgi:tetratricopeptide (TPR) repeat protein
MNDIKRKKAEKLSAKGFASIREGEYEAALKIAQELEAMRHTAAFDIGAQAFAGMDDLDNAVMTLRRGVGVAPECWLNWQLLGNYLSDTEKYDEAKDAYEKALDCPNVWLDSVHLNQGILSVRRGAYEKALSFLNEVNDDELRFLAGSTRVQALEGIKEFDAAASLAEDFLAEGADDESAAQHLGYIAAALARIRSIQGKSSAEVLNFVLESIEQYGCNPQLLKIIRNIDGSYSKKAKYFRMLIDAKIHDDNPLSADAKGYFITYDVVSDTTSHALDFILRFERQIGVNVLTIEESEALEPRADEPMGVYWRSGRSFYVDEE